MRYKFFLLNIFQMFLSGNSQRLFVTKSAPVDTAPDQRKSHRR